MNVYITKATYKKLFPKNQFSNIVLNLNFRISKEYTLYDFREFFNDIELKDCLVILNSIHQDDLNEYIQQVYDNKIKKVYNPRFYFDEKNKLSYHLSSDCEFLNRNYFNIKISPKVEGKNDVSNFKQFVDTTEMRDLVITNRRLFITKVISKFTYLSDKDVKNNIIDKENSGHSIIEREDLIIQIKNIKDKLHELLLSNKNAKSIIYCNNINKAKKMLSTNKSMLELIDMIHNKKNILMNAIQDLYLYDNKFDLSFDEFILTEIGLECCISCRNKHGFARSA